MVSRGLTGHRDCQPSAQPGDGRRKVPAHAEELRDRLVHFRVQDLRYPDPAAVLRELHGDELLQGRVLDLAYERTAGDQYAIVEVEGIARPVIVAVRQILGVME